MALGVAKQGPRLIGRARELEQLRGALAALAAGEAVVVQIHGEPGIGKTVLLGELCRRAEAAGRVALRGRGSQLERDVPFGVFVDALDDYLASVNPRRFEGLGEERLAVLGAVFPALSGLVEQGAPAMEAEERYRVHRAARSLFELLARGRPLVLALDDLHWADEASFELVHHLLRHPPAAPVLIAFAHRSAALAESWRTTFDAAAREGDLERLEPAPLSAEEAGELLGGRVDDRELRERLYADSGGNPFYLEQLAARPQTALAAGAGADEREGELPRAVVAALAEELAALGEWSRLALRGGAVAGDPFEAGLAASAAALGESDFLAALDELLRRDLVRPTEVPRRFRFRHPIVWRAVYEGASSGWRLAAHGRVADALGGRGAPPSMLAFHVERAAEPGDVEAASTLEAAGHAAAAHAPAAAARWFAAALRLLPEDGVGAGRRLELLVPMAMALGAAGQLAESRDAMREALALMPAEMGEVRARTTVGCAMIEQLLRRQAEAQTLLRSALAALADPGSGEAATLKLALASLHAFSGEHEEVRPLAAEARATARRRGDRPLEVAATALLAFSEGALANTAEAQALLAKATSLVEPLTNSQLGGRLEALTWLAMAAAYLERPADALGHAQRGLEIARETRQGAALLPLMLPRITALFLTGPLADAVAAADETIELTLLTGSVEYHAWAMTVRCQTLTAAGELPQALRWGERAVEAAACGSDEVQVMTHFFLAEAQLESGDPSGCRERILAAGGGRELAKNSLSWRPRWYGVLTRAELALGHLEQADEWAARAGDIAEHVGLAGRRGWALAARAAVELAQGEPARAAQTALDAAAAAAAGGLRMDAARAWALAGEALGAAGDREQAVEQLRSADAELRELGTTLYRDQAARELRHLGEQVPRAGRRGTGDSGPPALSERERQVAELVAHGRTNREIASALHVSEKTVEKHLARVFDKLGISRRSAVGATLSGQEAPRR